MIVRPTVLLAVTLRIPLTASFSPRLVTPNVLLRHSRKFNLEPLEIIRRAMSSSVSQEGLVGEGLTPFPSRNDAEQYIIEEALRFSDSGGVRVPSGSLACQHDRYVTSRRGCDDRPFL